MMRKLLVLAMCLCLCGCGVTTRAQNTNTGTVNMPDTAGLVQLEETDARRTEITPENAQKVLQQAVRPEHYRWENTVVYNSGASSRTLTNTVEVGSGMARLECREGGSLIGFYLIREGKVYAFDDSRRYYTERPFEGEMDYDSLMAVSGIADSYPISPENITQSALEGNNILDITVADATLKTEDHYRISMAYGVPISAQSTIDGTAYYSMQTTAFSEEEIDLTEFELPQGAAKRN